MAQILVSGLINLETTLRIDSFPYEYAPVRYPFFGVGSTISGVGFNVTAALAKLGDSVNFISCIADDPPGRMAREMLETLDISDRFIHNNLQETPQSVIVYDPSGRRAINVDLKDVQESCFPIEQFGEAAQGCNLACLCNVNFSRPLLFKARERGLPIATDVHAVSSLDDEYNADFMRTATILFMSDELLPCPPEEWAHRVAGRYGTEIIIIGLGHAGSLLYVGKDNFLERIPAVRTRPVVNTIGAGDALFSAFVHYYAKHGDPYDAIRKATVFASYKIGEKGAAQGFLTEEELEEVEEGVRAKHKN